MRRCGRKKTAERRRSTLGWKEVQNQGRYKRRLRASEVSLFALVSLVGFPVCDNVFLFR